MGVLAHGVGVRGELPLPLAQFTWAASAALVISFIALGALWQEPRLASGGEGFRLGWTRVALRALEPVARSVSLGLFVLVVVAGLFGADDPSVNVNPVTIYIIVWVVLLIAVSVIGDVWRVLSPFDTIALLIGRGSLGRAHARPPKLSAAAAPAGAFGFLLLELIHPHGDSPRILSYAALVYTAGITYGAWRWGRGWVRENETFAVLFSVLGSMAAFARDEDGAVRVRLPLRGLARLEMSPAATATILVVLGGTTFDGFGESPMWRDLVGIHAGWENAGVRLLGLIATIAVVAALYLVGIRSMATVTSGDPRTLAHVFAPSLAPIALGYAVAHYLQIAIDETQTFWFRLSDPLGRGWDLFGTAGGSIDFTVVSPDTVAWAQALAIVAGHIAGVVVAHDRAVASFDERDATRSQYLMLMVMITYSVLGLWLLFAA